MPLIFLSLYILEGIRLGVGDVKAKSRSLSIQINEFMNFNEYQGSRSFFYVGQNEK